MLELACPNSLPLLPTRQPLVCVLEHVGIARQESTARARAGAALDLHNRHRVVSEAAQKSGQRTRGEMTASLSLPVQLRLPATLDVDHRQRVMERSEGDAPPSRVLEEFRRPRGELIDGKIFRSIRAAVVQPRLERIEQRSRAGVAGLAERVGTTAAGAGNAQPQIAQRALREADQLWCFRGCHAD